jgi:hypothetical protein
VVTLLLPAVLPALPPLVLVPPAPEGSTGGGGSAGPPQAAHHTPQTIETMIETRFIFRIVFCYWDESTEGYSSIESFAIRNPKIMWGAKNTSSTRAHLTIG